MSKDGCSEWFNGEPIFKKVKLIPVRVNWMCPNDGCSGEMIFTGMTWPTGIPGYHHKCTECGETLAFRGEKFPAVQYEEVVE